LVAALPGVDGTDVRGARVVVIARVGIGARREPTAEWITGGFVDTPQGRDAHVLGAGIPIVAVLECGRGAVVIFIAVVVQRAFIAVLAGRADGKPLHHTSGAVDAGGGAGTGRLDTLDGVGSNTVAQIAMIVGRAFVPIIALPLQELLVLDHTFDTSVEGARVSITEGQRIAENTLAALAGVAHGAVTVVVITRGPHLGRWMLAHRRHRLALSRHTGALIQGARVVVKTSFGGPCAA